MNEAIPSKIGKYPVIREIGRGATSRVYLGRDPFANRDVAIKLVSYEAGVNTDLQRRFRKVFINEASLVGKLIHPHIMAIYDADVADAYSYIVMEYVDGPTLEHYCNVARLLPVERVVEIAFKCSLALEFAHRRGVIHRDIKPANILISAQGDIKISDFGVALQAEAEHTHLQGVGSPSYMSPEQVQDKELSHQTDIYSLGVVMYQLLTGKLPFVAATKASLLYQIINIEPLPPSTHRTDISPDLGRLQPRPYPDLPSPGIAAGVDFRHREVQRHQDAALLPRFSRRGDLGDGAHCVLPPHPARQDGDPRGRYR
jgi:serine/threonine protein kinase